MGWGTDFSDMQVSASYFDIPLKEIKQWRMTDATYKCADGADGGAGSAIGLGTISTLNLIVSMYSS